MQRLSARNLLELLVITETERSLMHDVESFGNLNNGRQLRHPLASTDIPLRCESLSCSMLYSQFLLDRRPLLSAAHYIPAVHFVQP